MVESKIKIESYREKNKENIFLHLERATWQGKTKLLPDERKRAGLGVGGSIKQGVSLSSIDVKLLQNVVAVDDDIN